MFTSLIARSQTQLIETEDGDTLICYRKEQSKYFLKTIYRVNELTAENKILQQQLRFADSVNRYKSLIIVDLKKVNANKSTEIEMQKFEIAGLNNCIDKRDKEIRRQKWIKRGIIALSSVIIGGEAYLLLRN